MKLLRFLFLFLLALMPMDARAMFLAGAGPTPAFVTPSANWRLAVTGTYLTGGDTGWNTAMLAQNTAKTLPGWSAYSASGATVDSSMQVATVASPGGVIYMDASIFTGGGFNVTVFESTDSVDGSPASGTWTQNPFVPWVFGTDDIPTTWTGRGQLIQLAAGPARWVRFHFVPTSTGQIRPIFGVFQKQSNGSNDIHALMGNSIIYGAMVSQNTRASIQAAVPGSDPIVIQLAEGAAHGTTILSSEINQLLSNPQLDGVLNVMIENSSGDIAFASGARPYSSATSPLPGSIAALFYTNMNALIGKFGAAHVFSVACPFVNTTPTNGSLPYVNGVINSVNGSLPYNVNQLDPNIKFLFLGSSWSTKYDSPIVDDYMGQASDLINYGFTTDAVHENTAGNYQWLDRRAPSWRIMYGQSVGELTLDTLMRQAGSANTSAIQSTMQSLFNVLYPTSDATALANRAAIQTRITSMVTTFSDITPTSPNLLPNSTLSSMTLLAQFDTSEFTKITRAFGGYTTAFVDRQGGFTMANSSLVSEPVSLPTNPDASAYMNFALGDSGSQKTLASTDSSLISALNAGGVAWTYFGVLQRVANGSGDLFAIGNSSFSFMAVATAPTGASVTIGSGSGSNTVSFTDSANTAGACVAFAIRRDAAGNLKYYRGGVTATGTTTFNQAGTATTATMGLRPGGAGAVYGLEKKHEDDLMLGAGTDAEILNVLGGLRQKWSDTTNTCI